VGRHRDSWVHGACVNVSTQSGGYREAVSWLWTIIVIVVVLVAAFYLVRYLGSRPPR